MKKLIVFLLVAAVLGGGGYYFWKGWQTRQKAERKTAEIRTITAEMRDIHFAVEAAGDIGPADQVSVRPEVNGRISVLPVDIGDKVKKGDLLCQLDDSDLQIERATQMTAIEGAKLQVEKGLRDLHRGDAMFEQNLIPKETRDDLRTQYAITTNSLERTESALRLVEDRLSKTKIMAPFDCTVLTRPVSIGQALSGSGGFNSGTEIMTIANLNDMIITAHINQADVTRLKVNQPVDVAVDSVPGLKMKGVVERLAPQATMKNNLKGFSARVSIREIDPRVRPGMTANLSIPVDTVEGVLALPLSAIFTEQGERFVYVKTGETYERRAIQIGMSDYSNAEIVTGLKAGETVALDQPADVGDKKGKDGKSEGKGATNRPVRTSSL